MGGAKCKRMPEEEKRSAFQNGMRSAAAGACAGTVTKTIVAPMERIKMLFQIRGQRLATAGGQGVPKNFGSPIEVTRRIVQQEGVWALYRGNGANVARIIPNCALKFAFNDVFKNMVKRPGQTNSDLSVMQLLSCGAAGGILQVVATNPIEVVRTRLTMSNELGGGGYRGIVHCGTETVKIEGWIALYKGLTPAILTTVPYIACQMTFYDLFKRVYPQNSDGSTSTLWSLAAGASAGLCAQTLCYPGDTMRRQLQTNGIGGEKPLYSGAVDCFKQILKREGVAGFYRGLPINVVKCIPEAGIQFATFDFFKSKFMQ